MSGELILRTGYDDDYNTCVTVGDQQFTKLNALGAAFPNLVAEAQADPKQTNRLAQAAEHLRSRAKLVVEPEQARAEIDAWAQPPLWDVSTWSRQQDLSAPDLSVLEAPRWADGKLIYMVWRTDWGSPTKHVFVQRLTLDPSTWEIAWENLDGTSSPLDRIQQAATEAFGALPEAFFRVDLPDRGKVLIGIGPDLPQRCAWLESESAGPLAFVDYAGLAAAQPGALDPKTLAAIADDLAHLYAEHARDSRAFNNLQVIRDGAAYIEEYRANGYQTFKLRYWVDELRVTACDCPDLDTVASPALEGNVLTAYFKGEKYQPFRVVADLSALTLGAPPAVEAMATETFVSDTRDGPGSAADPCAPTPELEPPTRPSYLDGPPGAELDGG